MLSIQIAMIVALLMPILHNPQNKPKVRNTMLTIFRTIKSLYSDDPDFQ